jgi:hypothetical protein
MIENKSLFLTSNTNCYERDCANKKELNFENKGF